MVLLVLAITLPWTASVRAADEIYKSVDAQGAVVYSDHADPSLAQTPVVLEDPRYPPRELHFCWTNCFTLVYDQGLYRRADGTDETWTVETFTARSVVLHRHDAPAAWNGFSPDVTYSGDAVDDRLTVVAVNDKPMSGVALAWGPALHALPGSNAERDARKAEAAAPPAASITGPVAAALTTAVAPPPLPDYSQTPGAEDGALWTPGYWYWSNGGYYWVPGAWMRPPRAGLLWTPAYWAYTGAVYVFHPGYWGPKVGFYGGINYGEGYFGNGYVGGRWEGDTFVYNRSVNRLNAELRHHSYEAPVADGAAHRVVSYHTGSETTRAKLAHLTPAAGEPARAALEASRARPRAAATAPPEAPPAAAPTKPAAASGSARAASIRTFAPKP